VEVDSTLVAEPIKFQERIRHLFGLVRVSLAEELNGSGNGNGHAAHPAGVGMQTANGNGHTASPSSDPPRKATASQLKAISAIATRQQINLPHFLQNRIGVSQPADLTLKQASQAIDELKAAVPQGA
jgi:hypothetical protein